MSRESQNIDRIEKAHVTIARDVVDRFKAAAMRQFPHATYAQLLGTTNRETGQVHVSDLHFPLSVTKHCGPNFVDVQKRWFKEGMKYALLRNCQVVGNIHSRTDIEDVNATIPDTVIRPDLTSCNVFGICVIWPRFAGVSGNYGTRTRFWSPVVPILTAVARKHKYYGIL